MKTPRKLVLALAVSCLAISALTSGCIYEEPPGPPVAVGVDFMPDYCFWDGDEYVGWYGGRYYYWGPNRFWVACDPVRVERVNVWVHAHPDWRTHVSTAAPARMVPSSVGRLSPAPAPRARRYYQDRGAGYGRKDDHDRR